MLKTAQIGVGYWGPNLLRCLASLPEVDMAYVCDLDREKARKHASRHCPTALAIDDCSVPLQDPEVQALAIATPVRSHFELASRALKNGKHVFVEKPLASSSEECRELIELARHMDRILMVGHVFEYNPAVRRIKDYIREGDLGSLFYIYSQRVNLGRIQTDVSALWSFAPHDVSILNYWLEEEPYQVSARGFSILNQDVADVAFLILEYPSGIKAHLHLGWLDPQKIRRMTVVGSEKMLVYDDVSVNAKITIHDKRVQNGNSQETPATYAEFQYRIRSGDILIPKVAYAEPLLEECKHFVQCVQSNSCPVSDGSKGLQVVKVIEGAERSLADGGRIVSLT